MVDNEHAALRLAHPTVVPDGEEDDVEQTHEQQADVDVTGSHPTVRATPLQAD